MAAQLELDTGITEPSCVIKARAAFGQHDTRTSSHQQFRRGDPAASRADDHHTAPGHRKRVITHAITAASALSD
jgi:hypothetical protein